MKPRSTSKPPKSPSSPHLTLPTPKSPSKSLSAKPLTLKRVAVLYNELKARDARSQYPWRFAILVVVIFSFLSVMQLLFLTVWTVFPGLERMLPGSSLYEKYDHMFYNDSDFAYIPDSSMMITTTAKAGSTAFWTWMHRGVTGLPSFDECNNTYIQNFHAPCWLGKVVHPFNMTNDERWWMVNRPEVLRVAITRDPYERLISAWKSKAACDSDDFGTDVEDRDKIVPILLRQADIQKDATCLSLTSFAEVLDKLRRMTKAGAFDINDMNKHFRPQQCFFNEIPYDMVLDVHDLANNTLLDPIVRRLKYGAQLKEAPQRLHASRPSLQMISEATAAMLYNFALLTESVPS